MFKLWVLSVKQGMTVMEGRKRMTAYPRMKEWKILVDNELGFIFFIYLRLED